MSDLHLGIRQQRKAKRPAQILQAALAEFSEKGFSATRLEDVAARAMISKGTIYLYFSSKEELLVETLRAKSEPFADNILGLAVSSCDSQLELLRRHLEFIAQLMYDDPQGRDILRLLVAEGHRFPEVVERWYADVMGPSLDALSAIICRGVETGEFRPSARIDLPHLIIAPIVLNTVWHGMFGGRRDFDHHDYFKAAFELLARGLLADPSAAPAPVPKAQQRRRQP